MFDSTAQRVHTAKTHDTALLRILVVKSNMLQIADHC